ncbi:MAG: tRNA (adenosine(37)-N6)-dimethylallyltransferase MiaA [Ferruginibacter sp.]
MQNKTCIIISGPTASGKTATAIELAQYFKTEIISADSRQCFKELNIGVAKPTPIELQTVPHHFINSHSIHQHISAADFEKYALETVDIIFKKNDIVIMAGGTGLYINAFVQGMDMIPEIDPLLRTNISNEYERSGIDGLTSQLKQEDPLFAEKGEMQNPQRMMRALEVIRSTGKSILNFQKKSTKKRDFNIVQLGLEIEREVLYRRINQRVEHMMAAGLLEEARALYSSRHLNALQTVGYREVFDYLDGKIDLMKAVELIQQNTRHYAKRQLTWFKKSTDINWVQSADILNTVEAML